MSIGDVMGNASGLGMLGDAVKSDGKGGNKDSGDGKDGNASGSGSSSAAGTASGSKAASVPKFSPVYGIAGMNPRSPLQSTSSELIDETVAIGDVSDMLVQAAQSLAGSGSGRAGPRRTTTRGRQRGRRRQTGRASRCRVETVVVRRCQRILRPLHRRRAAQLRRAIRLEPAYRGSASADHHASRVTGAWHTAHGARPACRRHDAVGAKRPPRGSEGAVSVSEKQVTSWPSSPAAHRARWHR